MVPYSARSRAIEPFHVMALLARANELQAEGHDVGKVDGLVGFATRTAIGQWQTKNQRVETCFPDPTLIQAIR